jgi:hypothetical protein
MEQGVIQGRLCGGNSLLTDGLEVLHGMPPNFLQGGEATLFFEEIRVEPLQILAQSPLNEPSELHRIRYATFGSGRSIR